MHYGRNFKLSFHLSPRWDQVIPSLALALDTVLPWENQLLGVNDEFLYSGTRRNMNQKKREYHVFKREQKI